MDNVTPIDRDTAARMEAMKKHPAGKQRETLTFYDPTEVIRLLADELRIANSREALEGYFNHLIEDDMLTRSVKAYGGDLGEYISDGDED